VTRCELHTLYTYALVHERSKTIKTGASDSLSTPNQAQRVLCSRMACSCTQSMTSAFDSDLGCDFIRKKAPSFSLSLGAS